MAGVIIAVLLGISGRTIVPYLEELRDKPETPFDRKFLIPPAVSLVIGLIMSPLVLSAIPPETLNQIGITGLAGIFAAAWGLTDIARSGQKVVSRQG
jgi:hypothetical protein